jgi:hypothetical protein
LLVQAVLAVAQKKPRQLVNTGRQPLFLFDGDDSDDDFQ